MASIKNGDIVRVLDGSATDTGVITGVKKANGGYKVTVLWDDGSRSEYWDDYLLVLAKSEA